MINNSGACPGVPDLCEHSQSVLSHVLEGVPDRGIVSSARAELGACLPCVQRIDLHVGLKLAVTRHAVEQAPLSLQLRITETLRRVDLGEIDVTDL